MLNPRFHRKTNQYEKHFFAIEETNYFYVDEHQTNKAYCHLLYIYLLFVTKRKYNVVTIVRVFNFVEVPT